MLCSVATPVALLWLTLNKHTALIRAVLAGDYLYFIMYDVPYRLVSRSLSDASGSLLVTSSHGDRLYEPRDGMSLQDIRFYASVHQIVRWFEHVCVRPCIMFAAGPLTSRLMEWLLYEVSSYAVNTAVASGLWGVSIVAFIFASRRHLIHCDPPGWSEEAQEFHCDPPGWSKEAQELSPRRLCFKMCGLVAKAIMQLASCCILTLSLMVPSQYGRVDVRPAADLWWAFSGACLYLGAVCELLDRLSTHVKKALTVKARLPIPPSIFVDMASCLEYDLSAEATLAEKFLTMRPRTRRNDDEDAQEWRRSWRDHLDWPSGVPPISTSYILYYLFGCTRGGCNYELVMQREWD